MAFINDRVYDLGLTILQTEAQTFHICSQEPVTYAGAATTYTLGNKASPTVSAPQDGAVNGRRSVISAIAGGNVTASGTATHWALVDNTNSRLLATGDINPDQVVTNGNTFSTTAAISITIPDAA